MTPEILNKFTTHLKNTLSEAAYLALELKNKYVNPEHLLYGLAESKGGIAHEMLSRAGFELANLKEMIRLRNEANLTPSDFTLANLRFSLPAKRALERAVLTASQFKHKYVGTEHLLFGLLELSDATLEQMLEESDVAVRDVKQQLTVVLKSTSKFPDLASFFDANGRDLAEAGPGGPLGPELAGTGVKDRPGKNAALDFFATNLTTPSAQQDVDPVVGREREIERLIHILSRRTKNNPVLVGDPGVGKTAIVEGLAKRILRGEVPDALANKKILALDLSLVVAGTIYRGEFESRLKQIIEEIKADPSIILFIDELHTLVGAGAASGSMDAANILKPALAKGQIRTIGATTLDEYRKFIESDPALERRFQPIIVEEPTPDEAVRILRGVRQNYERYHGVAITDDAIDAAVQLSVRYLQEKFLPDKAIDLIDEAASKHKVMNQNTGLGKQVKALERDVESLEEQKRQAVGAEDFDRALALKRQQQGVEDKLAKTRETVNPNHRPIAGKITRQDIAAVVSRITGVPLAELIQEEKQRLLHLEDILKKHIVGQDEAVKTVADYIRRSRVGLAHPNRPLGSFIFLGPSGVGKTQLAKVLADVVFEDPKALIRIDMSEFSESFNISKLIGAPAGYVGYKEGNKLTDAVRRKPYAVVLFDEIEKAHPEVFNLFLQILEDGQLTDASGKRVNFKNAIIIMTSNVGLQSMNAVASLGFASEGKESERDLGERYEQIKDEVLGELERNFRPEFLNRIDKIVVFKPLTRKVVEGIVALQIEELAARLTKDNLKLDVPAAARRRIAELGSNPDQGARAVRRVIQEEIENRLAEKLLTGQVKRGDRVRVNLKKDSFTLERVTT